MKIDLSAFLGTVSEPTFMAELVTDPAALGELILRGQEEFSFDVMISGGGPAIVRLKVRYAHARGESR